jgi:hypothetical protein
MEGISGYNPDKEKEKIIEGRHKLRAANNFFIDANSLAVDLNKPPANERFSSRKEEALDLLSYAKGILDSIKSIDVNASGFPAFIDRDELTEKIMRLSEKVNAHVADPEKEAILKEEFYIIYHEDGENKKGWKFKKTVTEDLPEEVKESSLYKTLGPYKSEKERDEAWKQQGITYGGLRGAP